MLSEIHQEHLLATKHTPKSSSCCEDRRRRRTAQGNEANNSSSASFSSSSPTEYVLRKVVKTVIRVLLLPSANFSCSLPLSCSPWKPEESPMIVEFNAPIDTLQKISSGEEVEDAKRIESFGGISFAFNNRSLLKISTHMCLKWEFKDWKMKSCLCFLWNTRETFAGLSCGNFSLD